jgi:hypothetical protein
MNFKEFIAWSGGVLQKMPSVRRYCETRIARAFRFIQPSVDVPTDFATVHRCDLARAWCDVRGLPSERARTALICQGVRHGLGLILRRLAQLEQRVALPSDVYPVYWRLASEAGVDAIGFGTFPTFDLPAIFDVCAQFQASNLVLPAPLKLHGREWTEAEIGQATAWLRDDADRRLILDGIYSFGMPLGGLARRLIEDQQVVYLDSLSKGWLHELVMGVAMVPERDVAIHAEAFRELRLPQEQLFRARALLDRFPDFPIHLTNEIDKHRGAMVDALRRMGSHILPADRGYLVGIESAAPDLLHEQGLLTIPATVFGSRLREWTIASALPDGSGP